MPIFAFPNGNGVVAQMVEQWTENPCVGSSILPDTTPRAGDQNPGHPLFLYIFPVPTISLILSLFLFPKFIIASRSNSILP